MPATQHTQFDCDTAPQRFREYLEGDLTMNEARMMDLHLGECEFCEQGLAEYKQMFNLIDNTLGSEQIGSDFDRRSEERLSNTPEGVELPPHVEPGEEEEYLNEPEEEFVGAPEGGFLEALRLRFGAMPWWIISGAFHTLLILLVTLIGMAILRSDTKDVVIVTDLAKQKEAEEIEEIKKRDVFKNPVEVETEEIVTEQTPIFTHEEVEVSDVAETDNDAEVSDTFGENGISDVFLGGTGTVAALGLGGGGGGAFGRPTGKGGRLRRAIRGGGSRATESAVDKALEWLARHQEADGSWDAIKYEGKQDARVTGINGNAAVTGYAILAFLGAGHTNKIGKYKDNVRRGIDWMIKKLNEHETKQAPGRYCNNHGSNYTQGVAGLALAEAAAMCRDARIKEAAQRAIDGVVFGQRKHGDSDWEAWGYAPKSGSNDTSVTGWNVMAIKSARVAGLKVDPAAFEGAMNWINAGQELEGAPQGGDAQYWEGGMMWYQGNAKPQRRGGHKNMALTSAAALTRLLVGGEKPDTAGVAGPCNLMKKKEHLPTENRNKFNLYYWYYGTLCMFQAGGETWKTWNDAMKPALINTQRKDGDFDGSWDPLFTQAQGHIYGGRVMSTALGAMCLEVYYRYLPLYRE